MIVGKCLKCQGHFIHHQRPVFAKCVSCGVKEKTHIICEEGHYYCNTCASKEVLNKLYQLLPILEGNNPLDISEELFIQCGISGNSPHPLTTASF